jgi:hypothetical protein
MVLTGTIWRAMATSLEPTRAITAAVPPATAGTNPVTV